MYDLANYYEEFQAYVLSLGLPWDINPADSPLFRTWMASNHPEVPLSGSTASPTPSPTPPLSSPSSGFLGFSQNQVLMGAALFFGVMLFSGKKRQ